MKVFLITSIVFLFVALICVVGVYWYVSGVAVEENNEVNSIYELSEDQEEDQASSSSSNILTEGQKEVLKSVGVDSEDFVVTPEMANCAVDKIGMARAEEIAAGAEPSLFEIARLLPCLR